MRTVLFFLLAVFLLPFREDLAHAAAPVSGIFSITVQAAPPEKTNTSGIEFRPGSLPYEQQSLICEDYEEADPEKMVAGKISEQPVFITSPKFHPVFTCRTSCEQPPVFSREPASERCVRLRTLLI